MKCKIWLAVGIGAAFATLPRAAAAQTIIGTVTVCYFSTECGFANIPGIVHDPNEAQKWRDAGEHQGGHRSIGSATVPPVDAPAFEFTNTGKATITGAIFEIGANAKLGIVHDVFHIGKLKAGASVVVVPGASNDKKTHPSGSFFSYSSPGNPLDTSDTGPDDNAIKFAFNGKIGTKSVSSGYFEPGQSMSPSVDGTVASLNFLGGPGNADGPCNDCYAAKVVANITTATTNAAPAR
jgi:hypothetical protein